MIDYDDFDQEPTLAELKAIEDEFNDAMLRYPLNTDAEKTLQDWTNLIVDYAQRALNEDDVEKCHLRFVQAGNLAARAARAVRTGEHK